MPVKTADDTEWEGRCRQCGLCCFEKIEDERGNILYTQTPCRYLDVVSRQCAIYERRFSINPICIKLTPDLVSTLRWLPSDCGYRNPNEESIKKSTKSPKKNTSSNRPQNLRRMK